MKKLLKVLGYLAGGIVVLIILAVTVLFTVFPRMDEAQDIKVQSDAATIERGRYLVENVATCNFCHGKFTTEYFGSHEPGSDYQGHHHSAFLKELGYEFEGLYVPNLRPANLKNWTDGEIYRAITSGIGKDNNVLFPMMPFEEYTHMGDADIKAIIAFLRTIEDKPAEDWPRADLGFPMKYILRMLPTPYEKKDAPPRSDKIAYGEYLTHMASCAGCHTPTDADGVEGQPIKELALSGGMSFNMNGGTVTSSNLTPHETGLGSWTEERFITTFTNYRKHDFGKLEPGEFTTFMPWKGFAHMKEEDLSAIFAYLQSLDPIENDVEKWTD